MPQIVVIGRFRYSNAKIMAVGHDWVEENGDFSSVEGMTRVDTFHISPDRGMAIYYFKKAEDAQRAYPQLQDMMSGYATMFECKITWEMGAHNESLSEKRTSQCK